MFNKFKNDHESVDDDPRPGRAPTSTTNESVVKIRKLVRSDPRLTIREIVAELNLSFYVI